MSVCANQDAFNQAFQQAVKYNDKKDRPKMWIRLVYLGLYIVFIVWALLLASKVQNVDERKEHFLFALLFGPVYVLAYYLGMQNMN
jgi:hypothetical protein